MRLIRARIKGYKSIKDSGYFDIEPNKTILVGTNEAGKTAVFQALQRLNPPSGIIPFNPLREYPRADYDRDIARCGVDKSTFTVAEGHFSLEPADLALLPPGYENAVYVAGRNLDNSFWHRLDGCPKPPTFSDIEMDLDRFSAHADGNFTKSSADGKMPSEELLDVLSDMGEDGKIDEDLSKKLLSWLKKNLAYVDETGPEAERYKRLKDKISTKDMSQSSLEICHSRMPKFVLYSNYLRVCPLIHLGKMAERIDKEMIEDPEYDHGNKCFLRFLGFTAKDLSIAGVSAISDSATDQETREYMDRLDERKYRLNAASIRLTEEMNKVWNPDPSRPETSKLEIHVDGQYLKVIVKDELGVEVELEQRSEGFQWTFSFLVVFFAESDPENRTILLLDEPGTSLHALKQAEFRNTISKLSEKDQTLFTTHSPFMIGADEVELVRIVEITDREAGTVVCDPEDAKDRAALLPVQEALGFDIAQSMFSDPKNLLLEDLADYWYIDTIADMMRSAGLPSLDADISLMPVSSASKIAYFAAIMHTKDSRVAVLSDALSGTHERDRERLLNVVGKERVIRSKDIADQRIDTPTIEDLMRNTMISVARSELYWDALHAVQSAPEVPILKIFESRVKDYSRMKLAKAFMSWARPKINAFSMLEEDERERFKVLIGSINRALE
jgi:energy-coupling factor transporter ATP-binding protein EcfA2